MILDAQVFFTPLAGQAITSTATSANQIDLGPLGRDFANLDYPDPLLVVDVLSAFASATPTATLTINLQGAPDNGSGSPGTFQTIDASPAVPLGQLTAGNRPYKQSLPILSELLTSTATIFGTFSCSNGATTLAVASATGLVVGQFIAAAGVIVPGTTVTAIAGAAVTISTATTASAAAGTAFAATAALGTGPRGAQLPRFIQLQFVCSATMTAGAVWAGIVLDTDRTALYAPGWAIPAGVTA